MDTTHLVFVSQTLSLGFLMGAIVWSTFYKMRKDLKDFYAQNDNEHRAIIKVTPFIRKTIKRWRMEELRGKFKNSKVKKIRRTWLKNSCVSVPCDAINAEYLLLYRDMIVSKNCFDMRPETMDSIKVKNMTFIPSV
jgi:hypothetical protein